MRVSYLVIVVLACQSLLSSSVRANDSVDFVNDVLPILQLRCYACHGPEKRRASFRMDIKSEAFKGGDSYEPPIMPGSAEKSLLIQFISDPDADMQMPPDERMPDDEIQILTAWVNSGAHWPDGIDQSVLVDKTDHWSFRPVTNPEIPHSENLEWPTDDIDRFILDELSTHQLSPSPEATPQVWLRRVTFDLTGLPPTPDDVADFLNQLQQTEPSRRLNVYRIAVDRLLDSPRYGERWGQHWLDVVRYADTHGFEVNTERPHAWPYRDYVIQSFNSDKPYDQFVKEQILGSGIGEDAATGFLVSASVLLPAQIGADEPSKRLARQDSLDEILTNVGQTFLGLSIGCARCHDHKFDPISHQDYYAMQALIAGVEYEDRPLTVKQTPETQGAQEALVRQREDIERQLTQQLPLANSQISREAISSRLNFERFEPRIAKRVRFVIQKTNRLEPCIDEIEILTPAGCNVALATKGALASSSSNTTVANRHELAFVNDGQYGNSRSWMSGENGAGWIEIELPEPVLIERVNWGRDRTGEYQDRLATEYEIQIDAEGLGQWQTIIDHRSRKDWNDPNSVTEIFAAAIAEKREEPLHEASKQSQSAVLIAVQQLEEISRQLKNQNGNQLVFAGQFRTPDAIRLLTRGDPEQPKNLVAPAILKLFDDQELALDSTDLERRRHLAEWIANTENPFTARVMVNRIWQGHFGTGLVETPSDFGRSGMPPSHPELLDYLAQEFMKSAWSVKAMHRRIVLSSTYRQASGYLPEAAAIDGDVRLLWTYPLRRHDAETIRDSILSTSGRLNLQMGGPGFDLFNLRGGLSGFVPLETFTEAGRRRMIYAHQVRRERDVVFGAFDRPDGGQSAAKRTESTTPLQALNLFNSQFILDESQALAERVKTEAGESTSAQIRRVWTLTLGREPDSSELSDAEELVQTFGLPALCRAVYNSNEFLFMP